MCGSLYCLRVVFASNELSWHLTPGMSRALQRVGSMPLFGGAISVVGAGF
jgi:hypothetical protein